MENDSTPPNPVVGQSPSENELDQASQSENNPRFSRTKKLLIIYIASMFALLIAGLAGTYWYSNSNQTLTVGRKKSSRNLNRVYKKGRGNRDLCNISNIYYLTAKHIFLIYHFWLTCQEVFLYQSRLETFQ